MPGLCVAASAAFLFTNQCEDTLTSGANASIRVTDTLARSSPQRAPGLYSCRILGRAPWLSGKTPKRIQYVKDLSLSATGDRTRRTATPSGDPIGRHPTLASALAAPVIAYPHVLDAVPRVAVPSLVIVLVFADTAARHELYEPVPAAHDLLSLPLAEGHPVEYDLQCLDVDVHVTCPPPCH